MMENLESLCVYFARGKIFMYIVDKRVTLQKNSLTDEFCNKYNLF